MFTRTAHRQEDPTMSLQPTPAILIAARSDEAASTDEASPRRSRRTTHLVVVLTALLALVGLPVLTAAPANAAVAHCGDGRCAIYLSINETKALGAGRIPAPPAWVPWQIKSAYYASAYAHRWFAYKYGSWNWCSKFVLDIRPWASQGYQGYRCSWW
jgi:hypothetical protein